MLTELKGLCPNCFGTGCTEAFCPDCGYSMTEVNGQDRALPAGTILFNRYLVGRVLGIGGFGITYKAYDTLYRTVCAVKEYAPEGLAFRAGGAVTMQIGSAGGADRYRHGLNRFIEEAQILKQLENVPAVVKIYECFKENQTAYFVMEYLDGSNLRSVVKAMGSSISSADITDIVVQVGRAMDVIHKTTGILHRDITPDNIYILKEGGVPKILDFGSAKQISMKEKQDFSVELKRGFAPPEQYSRTGRQGPYSDVYALATTYYYALTGQMLPDALDRLGGVSYNSLWQVRPDVSMQISDAVDRALVLNYKGRTQTMGQFVDEIQEGAGRPPEAGPPKPVRAVPYMEVLTGRTAGNRWNLPSNVEIRLGRSPVKCNIILTDDPLISKVHCVLIYDSEAGEFLLQDMSTNHTYVGGAQLEKYAVYRYKPGVEFMLAGPQCIVKAGISYE